MLPVGDAYVSERGTRIEITERDGPRMSFEPGTPHRDPWISLPLVAAIARMRGFRDAY